MTLDALVTAMAERLHAAGCSFGHGTTNADDEAAWLVQWRLGLPLDTIGDEPERAITPEKQALCEALIDERIRTRQPAAYLTGEAWLHGWPFDVDASTIVPRSLIAEPLLDESLDAVLGQAPAQVLDLCTGNGSLAVLAASTWPEAQVLGTDLSTAALAVAARNVHRHGLAERIALRAGDGLAALRADEHFDLVLCNPPYVNSASMAALPPEYQAEPALALAGGADGMDFIRTLIPAVVAHLSAHGALVLEIGHERAHFECAFPHLQPLWLDTSAGDEQVLLLTRDALTP